jgi:hypothetical protein
MEQDIKCYLNDSELEWRRIIVPTMQPLKREDSEEKSEIEIREFLEI